ncbi:hypothetical protein D3C77_543870 [compost metagenome]
MNRMSLYKLLEIRSIHIRRAEIRSCFYDLFLNYTVLNNLLNRLNVILAELRYALRTVPSLVVGNSKP